MLSISRQCEQGCNRSGTLLQNSEIVLMWVREIFLEKDPSFFVSASPVHMVFISCVLANIVVLYYIVVQDSSLSGSHAEDISTETTTKGCSSSLRMSLNTNLLLNDENIMTDKL